MIDSHTHLTMCAPPAEQLVADAVSAGVRRMLTVGIDSDSCRAALALAEDFPQVYVAIGRHPNNATGFTTADLAELRALAAHPRCRAIGETGLDFYREDASREDQERAFAAQIQLARETDKPLVIHSRSADDDTLSMLGGQGDGLRVILHCFSMPERLDACLERGYWISFAGNVTYPANSAIREAARARARRAAARRDRRALPQPAGRAQGAQPAGERRADGRAGGGRARRLLRRARQADRAQRRRAVRLVSPEAPDLPTQPSLRRLRAFGVRPKRDLGQNFLIDSNILDVIARAASLGADDVVLEIGGGLGVLSEHLAARAAFVHVVELDRGLEAPLREALDPFAATTTLHLGDAMTLDLAVLDPAPTKVIANLPYGIAAGAILRTVEELPSVTGWVAMVQKEVGERFAAGAGTSAYGVPSVLAQLACDVRVLRAISRRVFFPVPNVDSVLVGLERRGPAPPPALRRFVQGAFAHRRKALARSLAVAGVAERDRVRDALGQLGHPLDVRAERLTPPQLRALWEALDAAPAGSAREAGGAP